MDSIWELLGRYKTTVTCSIVGLTSAVVLVKYLQRKKPRKCGVDYPENVVMVYGVKAVTGPNLGHFVMKLETYLRVNKIPYKSVAIQDTESAPKKKVPYIEYNGVTMGDSQFIMEYLNKELGVNLNGHLSDKESATAWAIQKWLEEFTYLLNVHSRWVIHYDDMFANYQNVIPWFLKGYVGSSMRKTYVTVGVGRHTDEEIGRMIEKDLRCFSTILGDKPYIMGEKISEVDCAAFGMLCEMRWMTPDADRGKTLMTNGELKNVSDYLDRMRTQYWPDWDDPAT